MPHDRKAILEQLESHIKLNFNTILKLYTRIEVSKAARFFCVSEKDVLRLMLRVRERLS
jgi:hypothetical protein